MAKKINITAQLNAATTDGILADAGQIFDAKKGKFQEQVNEEFEGALGETITSEDTDMVVESIEEGFVHNALRKTEQILTEAEKGQARENIGAVSEQTFENEAVRVKKQVFTSEQKYQARHNISAITAEEAEKIAQDKINETSVSSPDKLQTIRELAAWMESNPDSVATMNEQIAGNSEDVQRLYRGTGIEEYSQFSDGNAYAVGTIVLYDGVPYKFTSEHVKGTAWDWNEVVAWSEKKEREERIAELESEVGSEKIVVNAVQSEPFYAINNKINVSYKGGTEVRLYMTDQSNVIGDTKLIVSVWYSDGTFEEVGRILAANKQVVFTLSKDAVAIGVGTGGSGSAQANGTIVVSIMKSLSAMAKIEDLQAKNVEQDEEINDIKENSKRIVLEYNMSVRDTRAAIAVKNRKKGLVISYLHPDFGWISEMAVADGTSFSQWVGNSNWVGFDDFRLERAEMSLSTVSEIEYSSGNNIVVAGGSRESTPYRFAAPIKRGVIYNMILHDEDSVLNGFVISTWFNDGTSVDKSYNSNEELSSIEFVQTKDVSYIAIKWSAEQAVSNGLVELKVKTKNTLISKANDTERGLIALTEKVQGYTYVKAFSVVSGQSIGATPNRMELSIAINTLFKVNVIDEHNLLPTRGVSVVVWYDDGTSEEYGYVKSNTSAEFTAKKNIIYVGNGTGKTTVNDSGVFSVQWIVGVRESINNRLEKLENTLTDDRITSLNKDKDFALAASKIKCRNYPYGEYNALLSFLVTTDVHADWTRFERALDYADEQELIDGNICLGDLCDTPRQLMEYDYQSVIIAHNKPMLIIPGNHEVAYSSSHTPFTDSEFIEKWYNDDLVAKNGDVHPLGKVYWHKDISKDFMQSNGSVLTKKIRIIGFDEHEYCPSLGRNSVYYTQEQIDWLIGLLDSVEDNMSVLLLSHGSQGRHETMNKVNNNFNNELFNLLNVHQPVTDNPDFIPSIINAWVNGETIDTSATLTSDGTILRVNHTFSAHPNQFICFLAGHCHYDFVATFKSFPNLYQIGLNCTTADENQQYSDLPRRTEGKLQDCITAITYDWYNHAISLVRFGSDVSLEMKDKSKCFIKLS